MGFCSVYEHMHLEVSSFFVLDSPLEIVPYLVFFFGCHHGSNCTEIVLYSSIIQFFLGFDVEQLYQSGGAQMDTTLFPDVDSSWKVCEKSFSFVDFS